MHLSPFLCFSYIPKVRQITATISVNFYDVRHIFSCSTVLTSVLLTSMVLSPTRCPHLRPPYRFLLNLHVSCFLSRKRHTICKTVTLCHVYIQSVTHASPRSCIMDVFTFVQAFFFLSNEKKWQNSNNTYISHLISASITNIPIFWFVLPPKNKTSE